MAARKEAKNKVTFTEKRIKEFPLPKISREYYYDAKTTGLAVCVTAKGARTFYLVRKIQGRTTRIKLGATSEMTLDSARTRAADLIGQMARGVNPQAAHIALRGEPTFGDLWNYWLENHAKKHKKPRSVTEDERMFKIFLKPWTNRKLSTIIKATVKKLHTAIGTKNGKYAANRVLALISSIYGKNMEHAADIGYQGENPAKGITRFTEKKRDRFLLADELAKFFQAVHQEPSETMKDLVFMAILTGARRSNVQSMQWSDIDFPAEVWRIPADIFKNEIPVHVPLVPMAMDILRRRKAASTGIWVFPSHGKTGHIVELKGAWKRIMDRAGLSDLRVHDLRRSLGSWMTMGGTGLPIVGKMLGHLQASTTSIYARLQIDPVRQSAESAVSTMLEHAKPAKRAIDAPQQK